MNKRDLFGIGFELAYIIALPVVALGLGGKWLDGRIHTTPAFTMAGVILAVVCSTLWIYRKFKSEIRNSKSETIPNDKSKTV